MTLENGHAQLADERAQPDKDGLVRKEVAGTRVGLAWLDRMGPTSLVGDDATPLVQWMTDAATSLVSEDREAARMRLLARAIASTRAHMALLETKLGEYLATGDVRGTPLVDRILSNTVKRRAVLLAEHRAACAAGRRSVAVAVGHAEHVTVAAGR